MQLFSVVDGVLGYLDRHALLRDDRLAAEAGVGLEAPGAIQQVFFCFVEFVQGLEAFAHDYVAGGAGGAHVAGVLDVDFVVQQGFADRCACGCGHFGTVRAVLGMRQNFDDGHDGVARLNGLDSFDVFAGQGFLYAAIHALCRKGFCTVSQGFCGGFDGGCVAVLPCIFNTDHQAVDLGAFVGT